MSNIILSGMVRVQNFIAAMKEDRGQDLVEYAVLVGVIGIVAFGVLALLGPDAFVTMREKIANCVTMDASCG